MALRTVDFTTIEQALAWKRSQTTEDMKDAGFGQRVALRIVGEGRGRELRPNRERLSVALGSRY